MDSSGVGHAIPSRRYGRLLSCSLPCEGISLDGFLAAAEGQPRFYWASGRGQLAFAGAGAAVELMEWGEGRYDNIARRARELFAGARLEAGGEGLSGPRLFGGFSFRSDFTPDNTWSIYAPAWFVLPHYQLVSSGGQSWLTINSQIPVEDNPGALIPDLMSALEEKIAQLASVDTPRAPTRQSEFRSIDYPMPFAAWERIVKEATGRIGAGALNKVVLARAAELKFAERLHLLPILRHLAAHYAECIRFLFEARPGYAFYGASPELLVSVQGSDLGTMALAGSSGRGDNLRADERLGRRLLNSAKNRQEHQIVVDKMRERLAPATDALRVAPVELLKLRNIQHLQTPIRATLKRAGGVLPLVEALHPTAALGGDPRPEAMRVISELEPIPRGWYGAPVGWINARLDGQFAVAIRSAVAQEARAWIYAGAGIVADSGPRAEWEETALKFRPMLDAHGA